MKLAGIEIPQKVINTHYDAELTALNSTPGYNTLAEQTAALLSKPAYAARQEQTALTPLTQFSIQATFRIMGDERVADGLPKEIAHRSSVASNCARLMATAALVEGHAAQYYMTNPHFKPLYEQPGSALQVLLTQNTPESIQSLATLGDAAFYDSSLVMGGALRFLQKERNLLAEAPAAEIVAGSTALQDITSVPDHALVTMRTKLGWPYANPKRYERTGSSLTFIESTRTLIRGLYQTNRGCPARNMPAGNGQRTTMLGKSWAGMASLFLTPDAIASGGLQKKIPLRR
jgi:hypothetical protein